MGQALLERDAGRGQLGPDEVEEIAHRLVEIRAHELRLGQARVAQILLGDDGEAIHFAHDRIAERRRARLLRSAQPLAELFGVEADRRERVPDLVRDLRGDAADGGEPLRAHQRFALRPQLPFAGGEALGHGVELVGEEGELVAAAFRHGDHVRRAAAEALRRLGQSRDGPERPIRKPGEEQPDGEGEERKPDDGDAGVALLPLRLFDTDVHLLLDDVEEGLDFVVHAPLGGAQAGDEVHRRRQVVERHARGVRLIAQRL